MTLTSHAFGRRCAALLAVYVSAWPHPLLAQEVAAPAESPVEAPVSAPVEVAPEAPADSADALPVVEVIEPRLELTLRAPYDVALFSTRQVEGALEERQCGGDCTLSLAPGRYRFALADRKRAPVAAPGTFRLEGADILEARYLSARNKRIAGSLLLALAFPAAVSGFVASLKAYAGRDEICDVSGQCRDEAVSAGLKASIVLGAVTMAAAGVLGSWLVSRRDRAEVRLRGVSPGNHREREAEPVAQVEPLEAPRPRAVAKEPRVTPADVRADDLATIGMHRSELAQCLPMSSAKSVLLDVSIDGQGRLSGVEPLRPLPERVQKCLQRALGRVAFVVAAPHGAHAADALSGSAPAGRGAPLRTRRPS